MKIQKGDKVKITKGKDRGKIAVVEKVLAREERVVVEGANVYKKHLKPRGKSREGGIIEITKPIAVGNVMLVCSKCNAPTRVRYKFVKDKKVRICRRCLAEIGVLRG